MQVSGVSCSIRMTESNKTLKSSPAPDFVNEMFLGCSHADSFTYCQWLLSHYDGRAELRLPGLQKLRYFLSAPLQEK